MNLSWTQYSQSSPGFVYFNSTPPKAETSDFIAFSNTSTPKTPYQKKYQQNQAQTNWNGRNQWKQNRFQNGYTNHNSRNDSYNSSGKSSNSNRSFNNSKGTDGFNRSYIISKGNFHKNNSWSGDGVSKNNNNDIRKYIHPSFMENPWAELEKQHQDRNQTTEKSQSCS